MHMCVCEVAYEQHCKLYIHLELVLLATCEMLYSVVLCSGGFNAAVLICCSTGQMSVRSGITISLGPSKTKLLCKAGKPLWYTKKQLGHDLAAL